MTQETAVLEIRKLHNNHSKVRLASHLCGIYTMNDVYKL